MVAIAAKLTSIKDTHSKLSCNQRNIDLIMLTYSKVAYHKGTSTSTGFHTYEDVIWQATLSKPDPIREFNNVIK